MVYQEVSATDWIYDKEGESIEGILINSQKDIGPNKSMLYSIETPNGVVNVWGAIILDGKMALTQIGDKIKITFKGLGEAKPGKKAPKILV